MYLVKERTQYQLPFKISDCGNVVLKSPINFTGDAALYLSKNPVTHPKFQCTVSFVHYNQYKMAYIPIWRNAGSDRFLAYLIN